MQIRNHQDFGAGLLIAVVGLAFLYGSTGYEAGTAAQMGPGYFPRILGTLAMLLGAVVTLRSLALAPAEGDGRIGRWAWRQLFFIIAANLVIGVMLGGLPSIRLPALGLVLGIYALTFISALAGDEYRTKEVFVLASVLAAACYVGFVLLLKLQFQVWPAFFD